jgi:hypothetical protein
MARFKIPIDYDATDGTDGKVEADVGFQRTLRTRMVADVQIVGADVSPNGMADIMALKEFIAKDLNSVVTHFDSSSSFASITHVVGGRPFSMPGTVPSTTLDMTILLDPLIQNMQGLQRELDRFLRSRQMFVSRLQISSLAEEMPMRGFTRSVPRYKPTMIHCSECHEEFLHTELLKDSAIWNEGEYEKPVSSDTVCPRCGAWDCCELEFERLHS